MFFWLVRGIIPVYTLGSKGSLDASVESSESIQGCLYGLL
jgi:hypothetical protein